MTKKHTLQEDSQKGTRINLEAIIVRPIYPKEEEYWDKMMANHHYLGFKQLVGCSIKYVAEWEGKWVALIGWSTAAFKVKSRDRWIGWSKEDQWARLCFIANNSRFLILPGIRVKNLASKVLSLNLKRLSYDWETIHGLPILLAETFVDSSRFNGSCYKGANWIHLGSTKGFGRNGGKYFEHGQKKEIFVYPLRPNTRELLSSSFLDPSLSGWKGYVDLNRVNLDKKEGLMECLASLTDPRKKKGKRHPYLSVLAIGICAVMSGVRNFIGISEWAKELSQDILRRLGCRYDERKGKYTPPSEPTIRRVLQATDGDTLDLVIGNWLANQCDKDAVAIDGKVLRGARKSDGKTVNLMSAFLHKQSVVVSQRQVDSKSNEITAAKPLLEPLNLKGTVVTADALHAQTELARYLKEDKQADYIFTVKGNQKTLLEDIQALEAEDFSPSIGNPG